MGDARISFVGLAGRAALIVDVPGEGHAGPLSAENDPVVWSFTNRGLRLLPAFIGQQVPETDGLLAAAGHGTLALTTPEEVDVLRADLDDLPDDWFDAAEHHEGVLLLVGRDLAIDDLPDEHSVAKALDTAAVEARLLGAVVELD